jgi:hypothetical protein
LQETHHRQSASGLIGFQAQDLEGNIAMAPISRRYFMFGTLLTGALPRRRRL